MPSGSLRQLHGRPSWHNFNSRPKHPVSNVSLPSGLLLSPMLFHSDPQSSPTAAATNYGTGFYIDIPNAKYQGADVDVILTAGHNLISQNKEKSKNLRVFSRDDDEKGWPVPEDNVKICPEYADKPNETGSAFDWAVIFKPKSIDPKDTDKNTRKDFKPKDIGKKTWKGFQFNLAFAANPPLSGGEGSLQKFMAARIWVSGYSIRNTPSNRKGALRYSAEKGWPTGLKRLSYKVRTEPGMSGSPVWAVCDDELTVVGIHTTGEDRANAPNVSQGVRLDLDILERLFDWTGTAVRSKKLKVATAHPFSADGLYLSFSSSKDPARVRLGADGLDTVLDTLPFGRRLVPDGSNIVSKNPATFVFRLRRPSDTPAAGEESQDQWVLLDTVRNRVLLSPTLQKHCAFTFQRKGKNGPFGICPAEPKDQQLTLGSKYIRREDSCYGPVESSEVSFTPWYGTPTSLFCFE
ncbi:uncharacterized protein P884DRAFT_316090 [Thermothelomyces heterothallicus CBS 202.75]|uniref:uncharacterized protein n=1 Tax=Thermothelomyces heterothallicus CBS 202.75 TaxID=1149848 RepID=UPI0037424F43